MCPAIAIATAVRTVAAPRVVADNPTELSSFGIAGTVTTLSRDETLFFEGDAADHYFKIVSGAVRSCTVLADGRRHIGNFFLPGDILGLGAVDFHRFNAEAVTETSVVRFNRRSVDLLVDERPPLSRWLLAMACHGLAAAERQKLLLARKSAAEKIATFLMHMAERDCSDDWVTLPMTRTDIGDYLGLTTETVSRVFTQLKTDGVIVLRSINELHILDRDALDDIAGEF